MTDTCAVFIKDISQKDNYTFSIEWSDSIIMSYRLCKLQEHCPCAGCQNRETKASDTVKALRVRNVGRYAIRIEFTEGCSAGIYNYPLLRAIGVKE